MCLGGERVFVVQRGVGDLYENFARRKIGNRPLGDAATDVSGGVLFDHDAGEFCVVHRRLKKVSLTATQRLRRLLSYGGNDAGTSGERTYDARPSRRLIDECSGAFLQSPALEQCLIIDNRI